MTRGKDGTDRGSAGEGAVEVERRPSRRKNKRRTTLFCSKKVQANMGREARHTFGGFSRFMKHYTWDQRAEKESREERDLSAAGSVRRTAAVALRSR